MEHRMMNFEDVLPYSPEGMPTALNRYFLPALPEKSGGWCKGDQYLPVCMKISKSNPPTYWKLNEKGVHLIG
jgi:hypothetical protein